MHVFRAVSMSVECFHSSKSLHQTPNMLSLVSRLNYLSIAFFCIHYQTTMGKLEKHFCSIPKIFRSVTELVKLLDDYTSLQVMTPQDLKNRLIFYLRT